MKKLVLKAEPRKILGRKVKSLRRDDVLPANVYGKKIKSEALKLGIKDFMEIYKQTGETGVVELQVQGKKEPYSVLIHNLQVHPVSDKPLHVDFRKIDLTEKVEVAIPVETVGEAPGAVKGGILVQVMNEIEVEALPTDLPEKFEVDVSKLEEIGQSILIKDLKVNKDKVKVLAGEEQVVVKVEAPKKEEEEAPPAAEAPDEETDKTAEGAKSEEKAEKPEAEEKTQVEKPQEQQQEQKK
jgi:large subunit ribosomal protein L25